MAELVLSGDEAVARAALDSGISAAFAYPGTPSTEIMEYLQAELGGLGGAGAGGAVAQWCANEKTAYESALGVSFVGLRAMVSMKHVGLNVAADPFVNSALVSIRGGLVVVVADDPGMHSSQDEQDSRVFADFARMPCREPSDQQEAYDMAREAFDFSEAHEVPVMIRLVTRLAHARAAVAIRPARSPNARSVSHNAKSWILMPANARVRWKALLEKQDAFRAASEASRKLALRDPELGVVTCGVALRYYRENEEDWAQARGGRMPSHLHIGSYPVGGAALRALAAHVKRILVLEEGYPYVERDIVGLFGAPVPVDGKLSGRVPMDGELSPERVREALGLPVRTGFARPGIALPGRPPQFCQGCPHGDSIRAIKEALAGEADFYGASDIGCYTLSALPPWNAVDTCVEMGGSVGMARGAAAAGQKRAIAMIGDSTFYHSGMTNLLDAVSHRTPMTVIIFDNGAAGMTGAQPSISPTSRLSPLLEGLGVEREHIRVLEAHRRSHDANVAVIRQELAYEGPSVVVMVRECIEWLKKTRSA